MATVRTERRFAIYMRSIITRGFVTLYWNNSVIFTIADILMKHFCLQYFMKRGKIATEAKEVYLQAIRIFFSSNTVCFSSLLRPIVCRLQMMNG